MLVMKFKEISLKKKIGILFTFIILSSVASIGYNQYTMFFIETSYQGLFERNQQVQSKIAKVNNILLELRRNEKDFMLRNNHKYIEKHDKSYEEIRSVISGLKELDKKNLEHYNEVLKNVEKYRDGFKKYVDLKGAEGDSKTGIRGELRSVAHDIEKTITNNSLSPELSIKLLTFRRREKDFLLRRDAKYLTKLDKDISSFEDILNSDPTLSKFSGTLMNLNKKYRSLFVTLVENTKQGEETIESFRGNIHNVMKISKELHEETQTKVRLTINNIKKESQKSLMAALGLGSLQTILILIATFSLFSLIRKLTSSSEVLNRIVTEFSGITNEVGRTSTELSSLTSEQAAAVQETAASVTEINSMVDRTTQNTISSKDLSETNAAEAKFGRKTIQNVLSSMDLISDSTQMMTNSIDKNSTELQGVVDIINTINEKTKVINDIVFQTKLLSFNASVEAARAGEHGKGFSVVAEEISNLANMSGSSAKEITEILESSVSKVQDLVDNNRTELNKILTINKDRVSQGKVAATDCDQVLDKILNNINEITEQVKEISDASIEQGNGVKEISTAINQMSACNQDIAAMSSKTDQLSQTIKQESFLISKVVSDIHQIIFGTSKDKKEFTHTPKEAKEVPYEEEKDLWLDMDEAS